MKRRVLLAAALAAAAVLPLAADVAYAQGRGRGEGPRDGRGGYAQPRAWDRSGPLERREWDRGERRYRSYSRDRLERSYDGPPRRGRGDDDERRRYERFDRDGADPAYAPPRRRPPVAVRRGGYLPPAYRGSFVYDYQRYRLRPPPHGYAWVRVGNGFALVSVVDGQIFDLVQ